MEYIWLKYLMEWLEFYAMFPQISMLHVKDCMLLNDIILGIEYDVIIGKLVCFYVK